MSEFLYKHDSKNLVQEKNCLENPDKPSCIDLFITNSTSSFPNTTTLSDFHKMILTVLKSTFPKVKPKQIIYRNFKNFDLNNFKNDIRVVYNGGIWRATGLGFFKFLTTLKKLPFHKKHHFFKITKK